MFNKQISISITEFQSVHSGNQPITCPGTLNHMVVMPKTFHTEHNSNNIPSTWLKRCSRQTLISTCMIMYSHTLFPIIWHKTHKWLDIFDNPYTLHIKIINQINKKTCSLIMYNRAITAEKPHTQNRNCSHSYPQRCQLRG